MRGEFIRGDGLVLPNNVTLDGTGRLLALAFRRDNAEESAEFFMGLCNAVYAPDMQYSALDIPLGVTAGKVIPRNVANWNLGVANGEFFAESIPQVFLPEQYPKTVSRLFLRQTDSFFIMALSSPLPAPLQITPTTPAAERTFRYRLYLR